MNRPKHLTEEAIKAIYDSFGQKGQNMTFQQFRKELIDLNDPKKMMDDLGDIELSKARVRMNRIRIQKAMEKK